MSVWPANWTSHRSPRITIAFGAWAICGTGGGAATAGNAGSAGNLVAAGIARTAGSDSAPAAAVRGSSGDAAVALRTASVGGRRGPSFGRASVRGRDRARAGRRGTPVRDGFMPTVHITPEPRSCRRSPFGAVDVSFGSAEDQEGTAENAKTATVRARDQHHQSRTVRFAAAGV